MGDASQAPAVHNLLAAFYASLVAERQELIKQELTLYNIVQWTTKEEIMTKPHRVPPIA